MAETMCAVSAVMEKEPLNQACARAVGAGPLASRDNVRKTASKKFLPLNGILQCGPYFTLLSAVHCLRKRETKWEE